MARLISDKYREWEIECEERFSRLRAAEEEINRYFIGKYGLSDELDPYVADKDVTIRRADVQREIKSLISYAVGCIFGRYSLDCEGLCYAGGDWNAEKYTTIVPVSDNVVPIGRQLYGGDLTSLIADFVEKVYGTETLAENLRFIADALGGEGSPEEVIEKYLMNGFFHDHCRIYHKRPIYWMFDSGRKCHLRALVYMHRFTSRDLEILRDRYLKMYTDSLNSEAAELRELVMEVPSTERPRIKRRLKRIAEQLGELEDFSNKLSAHALEKGIDTDDGVKLNYEKYSDVLEKIKP
ncbi:MAG: hypothetical protein J6M07_11470 [Ruminococcus sp.]|nr:hypothetical protein [Ruminococcus sp.]MBP3268915.1 hypothetical protein [Ruminococcus sp.]